MSLLPIPSAAELLAMRERRLRERAGGPQAPATAPARPDPLPAGDRGAEMPKRGNKPRRREPVPLEHEEQARFFALVDEHMAVHPELACVYAVPNFAGRLGRLTAKQGARLNREGRRKGVPDINCDVVRGDCPGLRIEMKRVNAKPSDTAPEQREWHARLMEQGYRVAVCRGHREAWAVLCDYLGIPNTIGGTRAA